MQRAVGSLSIREYWLLAEQGADQVAPDHQLQKRGKGPRQLAKDGGTVLDGQF